MAAFRLGIGLLGALLACSSKSDVKNGGSGSGPEPTAPPKPSFTVFALAEVRGQIGPCGCTSDPLGDIARTSKLVADARAAGPTLFVDAGSLLYSKAPIPAHLAAQEELKADLLASTYLSELGAAAVGLGPADLAAGTDKLRFPRHAVNLEDPAVKLEAPEIVTLGETKVGVFGVLAPEAAGTLKAGDPVATSKAAIADLKQKGAQVVIALVQTTAKRDAVKLVREIGGIDLAIAGLGRATPEPEHVEVEAQKVGDAWLVVPANRGQVVSRVDITLRGAGPFADAVGEVAAQSKIEALERQLVQLDADLAKFAKDPAADPAFVKRKQTERGELAARRDQLKEKPLVIPETGNYFTLSQIRINKKLACAPTVDARVTAYYAAAGAANVKAMANVKPAVPAKGKASFAGGAACDDCHSDAVEFWKKTPHARAWKTLVDRGQQFDFDCINCHVTGWEQPGGSTLAFNDNLRDVQCEVCHGPGSIHIAKGGEEKPSAVMLAPPADMCATQCHTKEHSDTFQLEAYMRDVLGPGHGEAARKKLGDGPTGAQLRKAALDKAGRTLGAGCTR